MDMFEMGIVLRQSIMTLHFISVTIPKRIHKDAMEYLKRPHFNLACPRVQ